MLNKLVASPFLIALLGLTGCANSNALDQSAKNQFVTQFYARVEKVENVKFKSYVGTGMALGAADGVLENAHGNKDDMIGGAVVGAIIGGAIIAILEGGTNGFQYQLHAVDGDVVSVIVTKRAGKVGDCVAVVVAGDVRMAKTTEAMCEETQDEDSLM